MQSPEDDGQPLLALTDAECELIARLREDIEIDFASSVREERDRLGWSQTRLAHELTRVGLPLDSTAITRIEKGERRIRLGEAWAIAAVMRFPFSDFIPETTFDIRARVEWAERVVREQEQMLASRQKALDEARHEAARQRAALQKALRAADTKTGRRNGKHREKA